MTRILLDHDDETGRVYIEREPAYGALPVEATPEEVAEWERVIAEFGRVQKVMYQRWEAALDAKIASGPPRPPQEPPYYGRTTTITRKDLSDDGFPLIQFAHERASEALQKRLGLP